MKRSAMRNLVLSALALLTTAPLLTGGSVEIIAHRGASHDAPENTMASVNLAWERDADAVEIDVYLSRDEEIVLFHDKKTDRIGGRDKRVVDQTLAELRQLDVGAWKHDRYKGERIPVLDQVLPAVPDGKQLYIELKTESEILPHLKQALDSSGIEHDKLAIICFDYQTIVDAKKLFPEITCYWLSSLKKNEETGGMYRPTVDTLIRKAKAGGVDGLDLQAKPVIDEQFVQTVKEASLDIYVWTVNEPEKARRLVEAGVEGITTDRPAFLKEKLELQEVGCGLETGSGALEDGK